MKKNTHPKMHKVTVTCSCGAVYQVLSTNEDFNHTEICSQCHPFFTGKGKTIDSAGRIDKFKKRWGI